MFVAEFTMIRHSGLRPADNDVFHTFSPSLKQYPLPQACHTHNFGPGWALTSPGTSVGGPARSIWGVAAGPGDLPCLATPQASCKAQKRCFSTSSSMKGVSTFHALRFSGDLDLISLKWGDITSAKSFTKKTFAKSGESKNSDGRT